MKPDRVVIGVDNDEAKEVMGELYAPFTRQGGNRVLFMDIASAEVTKYAANAMLATRISFMNQMALFCELVGADVNNVRLGIGSDQRIGRAFLYPGPGIRRLLFSQGRQGADPDLGRARASRSMSSRRSRRSTSARSGSCCRRRCATWARISEGKIVGIWGLAFKAETDDMRESPTIPLIEGLLAAGRPGADPRSQGHRLRPGDLR